MSVPVEFDHKSHAILLNGEFRRSEATESGEIVDPATENVIAKFYELGQ